MISRTSFFLSGQPSPEEYTSRRDAAVFSKLANPAKFFFKNKSGNIAGTTERVSWEVLGGIEVHRRLGSRMVFDVQALSDVL